MTITSTLRGREIGLRPSAKDLAAPLLLPLFESLTVQSSVRLFDRRVDALCISPFFQEKAFVGSHGGDIGLWNYHPSLEKENENFVLFQGKGKVSLTNRFSISSFSFSVFCFRFFLFISLSVLPLCFVSFLPFSLFRFWYNSFLFLSYLLLPFNYADWNIQNYHSFFEQIPFLFSISLSLSLWHTHSNHLLSNCLSNCLSFFFFLFLFFTFFAVGRLHHRSEGTSDGLSSSFGDLRRPNRFDVRRRENGEDDRQWYL